ncbi:MAG: tRNA dihydrouridine synthase DusB [Ruminococcaceae bacterium]|nr:tRNA dihydrouridine synthase DusB [Oscillospiraceae bacterium]
MKIGNLDIQGHAALAPMAGAGDRAFRRLCVDHGAALVTTEMVSAKGLCYGDRKSRELLVLDEYEHPAAIQLFGDDPDTMAKAASIVMEYRPDIIDVNMGCPAPKIAGNSCGSALMRDPDLCRRIIEAMAREVDVPVTAKIRKGYDKQHVNAVEVALAVEAGGAAAVTVHGRTRDQMYAPPVDLDIIREVKKAVSIPVIGNGDVTDAKSAAAMFEQTDCDMIAVGRAALGAPWIFTQIEAYLSHEAIVPDPPVSKRLQLLFRQTTMAVEHKGEKIALLQARKHAAWYMRGLQGAAKFRSQACAIETLADLERLCFDVMKEHMG